MNKARLFSSSPSCTQSTSIHNRLTPLEHWLLHAQLARHCCLSSDSGWELTRWQFEAFLTSHVFLWTGSVRGNLQRCRTCNTGRTFMALVERAPCHGRLALGRGLLGHLSAPTLFSTKFDGRNVDNRGQADHWG